MENFKNSNDYIMQIWPHVFIEILNLDYQHFEKLFKVILKLDNNLTVPSEYSKWYDWPYYSFEYKNEWFINIFMFITASKDIQDKDLKYNFIKKYYTNNSIVYPELLFNNDEDYEETKDDIDY